MVERAMVTNRARLLYIRSREYVMKCGFLLLCIFNSWHKTSQVRTMMRAAQYGDADATNLSVGDAPVPVLRTGEVLLKVHATAINRADTLQRKGLYPPPLGESGILGLEAAGVIEEIGSGCSGKWSVGDRVMTLLSGKWGGNAEFVAAHEDLLIAVPKSMEFTKAAAIPETWLTAFQLLHTIGNVQKGDFVLIHAGGSGVGTAAVQLSKLAGAKPIVTAGSDSKIKMAISLGAVAGYNYKEVQFAEKVLEYTQGHGADLILDCIGGSFYDNNINSVAVEGKWIIYGLLGGGTVSGDLFAKLLRKRVSLIGTTIRARTVAYKADIMREFSTAVTPHFLNGNLRPIIDSVCHFISYRTHTLGWKRMRTLGKS
ncbi:hypothetical protein ScPMuIL_012540 [Solemya velum]